MAAAFAGRTLSDDSMTPPSLLRSPQALTLEMIRLQFMLQPLRHAIVSAPITSRTRAAAVLIALDNHDNEPHLILTTRPAHLKAHPGQISFPGGKIEPQDKSPAHTAMREAQEEIGLVAENLDILGQFPAHKTFTGFEITPVVALLKSPARFYIDANEVADCFRVPLRFLLEQRHRHTATFRRHGRDYQVVFIPYENRLIWGATAAMIDLLCRHLTGDVQGITPLEV